MEDGELLRRGYRVLVLPRSTSLSEAEATQIRTFVEQGGTVIADKEPGTFDEHSRKLAQRRLADLFSGLSTGPVAQKAFGKGKVVLLSLDLLNYHQQRLIHKEQATQQAVGKLLPTPAFAALDASGQPAVGVEVHRFRNGGARLIALHTNPQLRVDELGPPEFRSNERFEKLPPVTLTLPRKMYVTDVRTGQSLGALNKVPVTLNAYEPSIFLVTDTPSPKLSVLAPSRAARGTTAVISVSFPEAALAQRVVHLDVADPNGKPVDYYSKNVLATGAAAELTIPLASSDPAGAWQIRIKDTATGQMVASTLEVF